MSRASCNGSLPRQLHLALANDFELARSWSRKVCDVPQRSPLGSSASGGTGDRGGAERASTPLCRPPSAAASARDAWAAPRSPAGRRQAEAEPQMVRLARHKCCAVADNASASLAARRNQRYGASASLHSQRNQISMLPPRGFAGMLARSASRPLAEEPICDPRSGSRRLGGGRVWLSGPGPGDLEHGGVGVALPGRAVFVWGAVWGRRR